MQQNNSGVLNTNKEQRLFLTTISRTCLLIVFALFGVLITISLIISLSAPIPWSSNELSTWRCSGKDDQFNNNCAGVNLLDKSKKITIQLGPYNVFNQETRVEYYFMKKSTRREKNINGEVKFKYSLYGTNVLNQKKQQVDKKTITLIEEKIIESKVKCKAGNE